MWALLGDGGGCLRGVAGKLITEHNLTFYGRLVAEARRAVVRGEYSTWAEASLVALEAMDPEPDPAEPGLGGQDD